MRKWRKNEFFHLFSRANHRFKLKFKTSKVKAHTLYILCFEAHTLSSEPHKTQLSFQATLNTSLPTPVGFQSDLTYFLKCCMIQNYLFYLPLLKLHFFSLQIIHLTPLFQEENNLL